jgi:hypothetical protein
MVVYFSKGLDQQKGQGTLLMWPKAGFAPDGLNRGQKSIIGLPNA